MWSSGNIRLKNTPRTSRCGIISDAISKFGYIKAIVVLVSTLILVYVTTAYFDDSEDIKLIISNPSRSSLSTTWKPCEWHHGDPVLFNFHMESYEPGQLKYKAGHWFHFAEHMLPWFFMLQEAEKTSNDSHVYLHLDMPHKVEQMNAFTRYLSVMAVTDGNAKLIDFVHFDPKAAPFNIQPYSSKSAYYDHENRLRYKSFLLDLHSGVKESASFSMEPNVQARDRLSNHATLSSSSHVHAHTSVSLLRPKHTNRECVQYLGTIGGQHPPVVRRCWFQKSGQADLFRSRTLTICPPSKIIQEELKTSPVVTRRLLIYQRDLSRRISNLYGKRGIVGRLRESLGKSWDVRILIHSDRTSACELSNRLRHVDVFITAHGFQSMLLMLLPRGALMYELYPNHYYKPSYGWLARNMELAHFHSMAKPSTWYHTVILFWYTTEQCMNSKFCRGFARDTDVSFGDDAMERLLSLIRKGESRDLRGNPHQWVDEGEPIFDLDYKNKPGGGYNDCDDYEIDLPHVEKKRMQRGTQS